MASDAEVVINVRLIGSEPGMIGVALPPDVPCSAEGSLEAHVSALPRDLAGSPLGSLTAVITSLKEKHQGLINSRAIQAKTDRLQFNSNGFLEPSPERHRGEVSRPDYLHYAEALITQMASSLGMPAAPCPDCKGSGKYVGLATVEPCTLCCGSRTVY